MFHQVVKREVRVEEERTADEEHSKDVGMDANPVFLRTTSVGDTVLLIVALCFHSVFEGIAIGVAGKFLELSFNKLCIHKFEEEEEHYCMNVIAFFCDVFKLNIAQT